MSITTVDKYTENLIESNKPEIEIITKKNPTFTCSVLSKSDKKAFKTFKDLTKTWEDIASDRLGKTRLLYQNEKTDEIKDKVEDDLKALKTYKIPMKMFREDIQKISSKSNMDEECQLLILSDKNEEIQAMGSIAIRSNEIYINTLFTAPWNLDMHGTIQEAHTKLVVRGAGSAFMRAVYDLAQKNMKCGVSLKPTADATIFYEEKMGMEFIKKSETELYCQYQVDPFSVPKALKDRTDGIVKFN